MRNAMSKDFFREIKYTFNRYVSILLIVALGVAFLAGIRATCPDMKLSLDYYLDQSDFMDLRVLSTLGLTDDDLQDISSIEGVKVVEGAYSYDAEVIGENAKWILRFLSEPQNVNKISLVEGRDIENPDECIVDRLMIDKDGYQIGDQLTVTAAGKDENVSDTLSVTTFTIVGAAASPSYFTSARDTTSIGTGQTDAFVYLSPEVFKSEAYSAAYLIVEGAAEKTAYSDAYDNVVDQVKDKLEAISEEREAARYNGMMPDQSLPMQKQMRNQNFPMPGQSFRTGNSRSEMGKKHWMTTRQLMKSRLLRRRQNFRIVSSSFRKVKHRSAPMRRSSKMADSS